MNYLESTLVEESLNTFFVILNSGLVKQAFFLQGHVCWVGRLQGYYILYYIMSSSSDHIKM